MILLATPALADPPGPAGATRPTVIAELKTGERIEGRLERFDDGEYWIVVAGQRRTIAERDLLRIDFLPGAPNVEAAAEPASDPAVAKLIRRFFRVTPGGDGGSRGVDPTLITPLAAAGPKIVRPLLAEYGKHQNDSHAVGKVLQQIGPEAFPLLVDCVREDAGRAAWYPASYALRESGTRHAGFVQGLLADRDPRIRLLAMDVLYSWGTTSGTSLPRSLAPHLVRILDDPDDDVRHHAPMILSRIGLGSPLVLPALIRTMEDDAYAAVRRHSVSALGYLARELKEGDASLALIVQVLSRAVTDDENSHIRYSAASHLGHLGRSAVAALPALKRATDDTHTLVREHAAAAIQEIENPTDHPARSKKKKRP